MADIGKWIRKDPKQTRKCTYLTVLREDRKRKEENLISVQTILRDVKLLRNDQRRLGVPDEETDLEKTLELESKRLDRKKISTIIKQHGSAFPDETESVKPRLLERERIPDEVERTREENKNAQNGTDNYDPSFQNVSLQKRFSKRVSISESSISLADVNFNRERIFGTNENDKDFGLDETNNRGREFASIMEEEDDEEEDEPDSQREEIIPEGDQRSTEYQEGLDFSVSVMAELREENVMAAKGPAPKKATAMLTSFSDLDLDGDIEEAEPYHLAHFDFEHLTKRDSTTLTSNQVDYKIYCQMEHILPNGHILRNLPTKELRLNSLCLGTERIKALCSALLFNSTVAILEISEDNINTKAMQYLVETFQDNSTIEALLLSDNKMGRRPVKMLVDYLCSNDQLVHLGLAGNRLKDTDGDILVNYISNTQNLGVLDLSHNELELEAAIVLSKALMTNTSIHTLSLCWNHMGGEAVRVLLGCFKKNNTLVNLDLSWNGFNSGAVKALCLAIKVSNSLTTLDLSTCRLTGPDLTEIVAALKKGRALRNLCLGNNIFSCKDVYSAVLEFANVKGQLCLRELDLSDMAVLDSVLPLAQKLMEEKDMMIYHGPVLGRHQRNITDADLLASINPVTILIEFGTINNMSLQELFDYMDEDQSGTLTRDEIKDGLMGFNIPLSDRSLDLLIRRMDRDGDGVIDFQELIACGVTAASTRSRITDILSAKEAKGAQADTGNIPCRKILKRMLAEHESAAQAQREKDEQERIAKEEEEMRRMEEEAMRALEEEMGVEAQPETEATEAEAEDGQEESDDEENNNCDTLLRLPPIGINNKVTGWPTTRSKVTG